MFRRVQASAVLLSPAATQRPGVVRQSALQVQQEREQQRQERVVELLRHKSRSTDWLTVLQKLEAARETGARIDADALAPAVRATQDWDAAKYIFFDVRRSVSAAGASSRQHPATDSPLGLAMYDAAAQHGRWHFALAFLSRAISERQSTAPTPAAQPPLSAQAAEALLFGSIASLHNAVKLEKAAAAGTAMQQSAWALALATTAVMRNPHKAFRFERSELFAAPASSSSSSPPPASSEGRKRAGESNLIHVAPRADACAAVPATPELIARLVPLLAACGRWSECVALLRAADRQEIALNGPTVVEHAIRACYEQERHELVAALTHRMLATQLPMREQVARMAMRSLEEVAASSRRRFDWNSGAGSAWPLAAPPPSASWVTSLRLFGAIADQGLALTRQTYESPLRCCAVSGRWVEAARVAAEMRRDGLTAGHQNIETVLCAKIEHGCASADEAFRLLLKTMPGNAEFEEAEEGRPGGAPGGSDARLGILQLMTARAFNAVLAAAVRDNDAKTTAKVLRLMQQREVPRDKETQKWLIRATHRRQRWELVLRHFLFLRKEVMAELGIAAHKGYRVWPQEHALDDDVARMVLEACEMIGFVDPLSRNVAEAVLAAKGDRGDGDGDDASEVKLLPPSAATSVNSDSAKEALRNLSRRTSEMTMRLRRAELGVLGVLPGQQQQQPSKEQAPTSRSMSTVRDALGLGGSDDFLKHYDSVVAHDDIPEVPN